MLPSAKQAGGEISKLLEQMKKRGEASVTVTRVSYATDPGFSENPPSCRVTVTVTDPGDSTFLKIFSCDLFTATAPENTHEFTIPVEKVFKLWGKKRRTLRVSIVADPNNGFEDYYESMKIDAVEIAAGTQKPLTVSLKPKNKPDQTGQKQPPRPNRLNP